MLEVFEDNNLKNKIFWGEEYWGIWIIAVFVYPKTKKNDVSQT